MKNTKYFIPIAVLLICLVLFIRLEINLSDLPENLKKHDIAKADLQIPEMEKQTLIFLLEHMSGPQLSIYTNYLNTSSNKDAEASGKDILAESQGLLLLYLINLDKKEYFDLCLNWTVSNLSLKNGMFSWVKRKTSENEKVNALIDDLRIIKAQISAYEKWEDEKYLKLAKKAAGAILKYNIQDSMPQDFYDLSSEYKANHITISYLDLYTMKKLTALDSRWEDIYLNSYELIRNAKIEGTGLYKERYDYHKKEYMTIEEISLVQSIYTMLHLGEIGQHDKQGLKWLMEEYEKHGKLYAYYSSRTYEPVSEVESTALYALASRVFYLSGDIHMAEKLLSECKKFQVQNKASEIYGSFGDERSMKVYSFDNLQYILTSSMLY